MLGEDTLMTDMLMADMLGEDMLGAHTMMADTLGCGCWRWPYGKSLFFTPNVHLYLAFFL